MNLTDLKQVLDEHSGDPAEHVMHHLRLQGVRAKVVARRRRRVATWAACAIVLVAGVAAAAVVPGLHSDVTPTPADSPPPVRTIEGFPEYANGARVVAAKSAELSQQRLELTIVPTTLDLVVFNRCDGSGERVGILQKVTVNGREFTSGGCGGAYRSADWAEMGVTVGSPATFVVTITGAERFDDTGVVGVPIPHSGTFALAVGERIPFDRYPLPPRPSGTLAPLSEVLPSGCSEALCPDAVIIRSDAADPTRPVRRTVTWKTLDSIDMVAQTPGLLHLRINGVEITTGEWWDYAMTGNGMYGDKGGDWKREFGLDLHPGDSATIEIVPEHITGAWQVVLSPDRAGGGG
ncbi:MULTISPECIES: hypothetical protein [Micromonospora]|uniref:DUF4179 domain-containing protein n=1 Tax=Micromonospora solifontis TaxID=2487138 RepID=A0ABX9WIB8_9ACTN|nr:MULTISPECIES: hypothetical protein [Micromonospora]NES15321.1 hypothetical protein [Micromonospora sp. PPF5-17B]NES36112.1 hypothetical protein [Micromonospora solifontis]NES56669.1 hypothetical protein [Micromonospora sp. PPF5-6]RNL99870.1 hypothetical protein EFE23_08025 [Micromonospora solifontis]